MRAIDARLRRLEARRRPPMTFTVVLPPDFPGLTPEQREESLDWNNGGHEAALRRGDLILGIRAHEGESNR